jgi:hypothetical protein
LSLWGEGHSRTGLHAQETFLFARERFDSKVAYHRLYVHYLSPEAVGMIDIVFCAGVLYHLAARSWDQSGCGALPVR